MMHGVPWVLRCYHGLNDIFIKMKVLVDKQECDFMLATIVPREVDRA